jgi:hypothetical protein
MSHSLCAPPLPPAEVQHGCHATLPPLHVVTVISNPVRWNSRAQLYHEFAKRVEEAGAILYTVELAFGERPYAVTCSDNPRHFQFRTSHELWHKENLIRLAFARMPLDSEYLAWVDADVAFSNPHWVNETIQQLQHHRIVQMFTYAIDQGPNYEPMSIHRGFVFGHILEPDRDPDPGASYGGYGDGAKAMMAGSLFHPGFAWAARRSVLDEMGGLYDKAVMGSADTYMARGLVGKVEGIRWELSRVAAVPAYNASVKSWQAQAFRVVEGDLGYVDSTLVHYWHGKKRDRMYYERNKVLIDTAFNPNVDLIYDTRGVLALSGDKPALRDGLRRYFRLRNEDSIDL